MALAMMRQRVNRGLVSGEHSDKASEIEGFRAFAASLEAKRKAKQESVADSLGVDRAVDVFNNVFDDDASAGSEDDLKKRVGVLEMQLEHAREAIAQAKRMDNETLALNAQLERRVEELTAENQKLYALAGYLRHFERENHELRFMLGDFFKPSQAVHQR